MNTDIARFQLASCRTRDTSTIKRYEVNQRGEEIHWFLDQLPGAIHRHFILSSRPCFSLPGESYCCCNCAVGWSGRYSNTAGSHSPTKESVPTAHRSSMSVPAPVSSYSRMAGCCPNGA